MKFSFVLLILFTISNFSNAQEPTQKKFQAGFSLSPNYSFLQAKGSKPKEMILEPGFGLGVGLLGEYHPTKRFSVSTRLGLSFNNIKLTYQNGQGDAVVSTDVYKQNLEASLLGQFALGSKNKHPYLLFGPSIYIPLQKIKNPTEIIVPQTSFSIDIGFGLDVPFTDFRFAPELRYSYGINNMVFSPLLDQLFYHRLTLALNFKD